MKKNPLSEHGKSVVNMVQGCPGKYKVNMSAISDNLWSRCTDYCVDTVTMSMTTTVAVFALSMRGDVAKLEKTSKKCWIKV